MNSLVETLKGIGPARLLAMGGVALALLGAFAFLAVRLAQPQMAMLYGDLDLTEAGNIVTKLEALNVPVELRGNGAQVFVPADQVLRLRMNMAEAGLPSRGSVGYELFDRSEGLGTTSFVQNINQLRALEGELARTVRSLDRIAEARVHLVLPRRELFSRQAQQPSASIVVRAKGGQRLDADQVQAIQHLVAAAVPDLKPENVAIVDEHGTLLSRSATEGAPGSNGYVAELRRGYEMRMKQNIEALLEQSLGLGKARVEVAADMNFDRVTTNAESYDPDSKVARSTQSVDEKQQSQENRDGGTVTVKNNLPEAQAQKEGGPKQTSTSQRSEETVNYEISKTVTTKVHESGAVKRLSVAVLVDGNYVANDKGERQYQPRSKEELEQIAKLVRTAMGYAEDRGDKLEVVNMRFARLLEEGPGTPATEPGFSLGKADYMRIGEIAAFVVVGLLTILLVLRPLLLGRRRGPAAAAQAPVAALPAGQLPAMLAGPGQQALTAIEAAADGGQLVPAQEQMIDIARIEGQVKASSLRKLGELVEKHPEEAVAIVRSWMYQRA